MKFLITLGLLAVVSLQLAQAAPADKVDCTKFNEALDEYGLAQGITTLQGKDKMFTSVDEYVTRCQAMTDAIKTLRKYNKECNTALTQQVLSAVLRTRSQMIDSYCTKPSSSPEAQEIITAIKCIKESAFDDVNVAEKKTLVSTQVLFDMNIADEKLRVRRSCCNVLNAKTTFLDATKAKCNAHKKVYEDYYESYTSEAMGLICPEADKLDCDKLEALKLEGVEPKSKFFLTPMIKLVKTLDH